jgi:hypothetical protein
VSFGPLITIERQLNDLNYYCSCKIDNSLFLAHVDTAYCEEIADEFAAEDAAHSGQKKKACRFLRKNRQGEGTLCAVYSTQLKNLPGFPLLPDAHLQLRRGRLREGKWEKYHPH